MWPASLIRWRRKVSSKVGLWYAVLQETSEDWKRNVGGEVEGRFRLTNQILRVEHVVVADRCDGWVR